MYDDQGGIYLSWNLGAITSIKCISQTLEKYYKDTRVAMFVLCAPMFLAIAGWTRDGHVTQYEFILGIRNCDCEWIAINCLFLNLKDI